MQDQTRTYHVNESVVFNKTDEEFGGLSNMAGGYPLRVNGIDILTSEALYQACRFPHMPEIQRLLIEQKSPMTAKMKTKPYLSKSRPDWQSVRVSIMHWCLRVKLVQNFEKFSQLLLQTDGMAIVEKSRRDAFWGAKPMDDQILDGTNVLGRLLMELREELKQGGEGAFKQVEPPAIADFLLDGQPVGIVEAQNIPQPGSDNDDALPTEKTSRQSSKRKRRQPEQLSLFDDI